MAELLSRIAEHDHLLSLVFLQLDVPSIAACRATCRRWRHVGSGNDIWAVLCDWVWADKAYIPAKFRALRGSNPRAALAESVVDSRRTHITAEELCSTDWYGRMKGHAGPGWLVDDPWWKAKPARTRQFMRNGTVRFERREGGEAVEGTWHFLLRPPAPNANLQDWTERGDRLRIRTMGRELPTLIVSRAHNWGFLMQNCWGLCTSFPLPLKGEAPELEDDAPAIAAVSVEAQAAEAYAYNAGHPLPPPPGFVEPQRTAVVVDGEFMLFRVGEQLHRVRAEHLAQFVGEHLLQAGEAGEDDEVVEFIDDDDDDAGEESGEEEDGLDMGVGMG